ncbi:MAG TPA: S8/S53 family peptidase [Ktedonobacteraceae bacterium]|nr:S8/S53 family peptidase [Ktedonobacteraceae bacterium]
MDMQSMSGHDMANEHNTFWHEDQLILTFHSPTRLISDGVVMGDPILGELRLEEKLPLLNSYLRQNGMDYTLSFLGQIERMSVSVAEKEGPNTDITPRSGFSPRSGIYMFDVSNSRIKPTYGEVNTSILGFFNFTSNQDDDVPKHKVGNDESNKGGKTVPHSPVVRAVNLMNQHLNDLNNGLELEDGSVLQISISATSPNLFSGGTPTSQGCPLTPAMPVEDDCALWRFKFPKLTPNDLQKMTGKGVTVFILDTLPDLKVIKDAAEDAGDDNLLLLDVNKNVKFHDVPELPILSLDGTEPVTVGKDVYGRHFPMIMPDHGLFIAGIVSELAPDATVECIRVLNKYGVGDVNLITQALVYIESRMSVGGDLNQQPVVINMSLVIPTVAELMSMGMDFDPTNPDNNVFTHLLQQIQNLVGFGAIIAAAAGNEGDLRENPSGTHPGALYPAAFANPPYSIDGIIPVGAINRKGKVTSYSCYPGLRGIATYGGEVPGVDPKDPDPNNPPIVTISDAVRGIYSSDDFPPLSSDPPSLEYPATNDHAWAYWIGTSFATPIISALAARIFDWRSKGNSVPNVHNAVIAAAGTDITKWEKLDQVTTGVKSGSATGPMIIAKQRCKLVDIDDDDKDEEIEIVGEL